tara:strand:+ start:1397 stop:1918 length:522 start_codon:yes stop_codon:yes gene_type:complete
MGIKKELRDVEKGMEGLLKSQGYKNPQKRVGFALTIIIIALIAFSGYFLFFYSRPVNTSEEFLDAMANCRDVSWIREDAQASWLYKIKGGINGDACEIEVVLLKMKEGTIESEKLQGKTMTCSFQKGESRFPEKDISRCSGVLKEELQDIIIQRMHNYLLQNVGEIREEFEGL